MGREKILIVDDDDGVREMLAEFFGVLGYPSIVACNGREALGLLETQEVALVISDIRSRRDSNHRVRVRLFTPFGEGGRCIGLPL
ncbi:MAG: hypothetical protein JRH07_11010 [Deltaproteobacteria bacterium]|nr:hypothetical protein [Deltaproteobacteria bacterium]